MGNNIGKIHRPQYVENTLAFYLMDTEELNGIVSVMPDFTNNRISSHYILSKILIKYLYRTGLSAYYYSLVNLNRIQEYMEKYLEDNISNLPDGFHIGQDFLDITEKELNILQSFTSGSTPISVNNSDVNGALVKVGLTLTTKMNFGNGDVKVIDCSSLGAKGLMAEYLIDAWDSGLNSNNFRFVDIYRIVDIYTTMDDELINETQVLTTQSELEAVQHYYHN